ncbi:MAG: hypothetical protein L0Z55_09925 [Planctomycetes bacterium]|nr:hypothetical protein [Planctomycetota bacterium]
MTEPLLQQAGHDSTLQVAAARLGGAVEELVRGEIRKSYALFEKKLEERIAELPKPSPSVAVPDAQKLAQSLSQSGALRTEINKALEESFKTLIPQLIQRFRQDIDQRVGSQGGGGGGGTDVHAVVSSTELKEMLEERFRAMLLFIKQDVIPKELQRR